MLKTPLPSINCFRKHPCTFIILENTAFFRTPEQVAQIMALIDDGRSQRYAARSLNLSEAKVRRAVARFRETGQLTRRVGSGRPRCTSNIDDRFIVLQTVRNRFQNAVTTNNRLRRTRHTNVSDSTVRRRLKESDFHARRPATAPKLLRRHRLARLAFARERQNWNLQQWSKVLFSDESRFCLWSADGRQRVWRRRGERYDQNMFSERTSYEGGSVMVWAGISLESRTELCVLPRNSLNAVGYTRVVEEHVVPFAPFIGEGFILMQDNARPHVARIVNEYLDEAGIERMPWPAISPDMNPIEHLWDQLGRRVRGRENAPENLQKLTAALVEEWANIPQENIANLIRSMPRCLETLIRVRGGNTRY